MSVLLPALLAAAAAAVLVALPRPGRLRLADLWGSAPRTVSASPGRVPTAERSPTWLLVLLVALPLAVGWGPVAGCLLVLALLVLRGWQRRRVLRRAADEERAGAGEACATLAAELRAGRNPADALSAAAAVALGPCREALTSAAAAARMGGDVPAALTAGAGSELGWVLRSLAACWTVCATSGSGLAAAVERLEEGLRAEQAQRRAVAAELAGPRATAGLLAVLPAAGLLLAGGLGADPLHVLLSTPLGLVCLVLGLGLDGLGVLWTTRLVARAGRAG